MAGKDVTKLSSKFQISVPKSVREKQKWKPGQKFAFVPNGKSVVLVPMPTLDELFGIARGANTDDIRDHDD
jgi:AbrB family looped-hinge helix DNA binding protein